MGGNIELGYTVGSREALTNKTTGATNLSVFRCSFISVKTRNKAACYQLSFMVLSHININEGRFNGMDENRAKPEHPEAHEICINAYQIAEQDLFALSWETQRTMAAYGFPTIYFTSDMMEAATAYDELGVIIKALEAIRLKVKGAGLE